MEITIKGTPDEIVVFLSGLERGPRIKTYDNWLRENLKQDCPIPRRDIRGHVRLGDAPESEATP